MEGLRKITVDGHALRWRFDWRGRVVVIPADRSGPQLYVSWGWRDHLDPGGPGEDPQWVTPSFVAKAIQFALKHGWNPAAKKPSMRLKFESDRFSVVDNQSPGTESFD